MSKRIRWCGVLLAGVVFHAAGCAGNPEPVAANGREEPAKKEEKGKVVKEVGKNVFLEVQDGKRRVVVHSYVCLRRGQLEQLLTRKRTKEHEAILAADVDARMIHAALLAAGAEPGATVKYKEMGDKLVVIPPRGTSIKITLRYTDAKKKLVKVPAQQWLRQSSTGKILVHDWVFAGSVLYKDPLDENKAMIYGANDGDIICVANFDTALLDLPINSSKSNDQLAFEAFTDRIPPVGTKVDIILEPVLAKKTK